MEQVKKNKKWVLIAAAAALFVLVAVLLLFSKQFLGKAAQGAKAVTIEITKPGGNPVEQVLHTDAETLEAALTEANLITGHTEEYGFFVERVDGYAADAAKSEWWMFTKDGEWVTTGVSDTLIADGDHYEFFIYAG